MNRRVLGTFAANTFAACTFAECTFAENTFAARHFRRKTRILSFYNSIVLNISKKYII